MSKSEMIYDFVNMKINQLQVDSPWSKEMLAKMRRGIGKNPFEIPNLWEVTLSGIPEELIAYGDGEDIKATESEWAIHTALTLYALHQQGNSSSVNSRGRSFASAARLLISPDGKNEKGIKRRFDAMVTAGDLAELSHHARSVIQLMKASDLTLSFNYPNFAKDLYSFQFPNGKMNVRLRWGQDFYRFVGKNNEEI